VHVRLLRPCPVKLTPRRCSGAQREQWKNIGYAIKALDVNSHMHIERVAQFGGRTGLAFPEQIRKLLARFAITFSDGYFNLLISLIDKEPNGEVGGAACLFGCSRSRQSVALTYRPLLTHANARRCGPFCRLTTTTSSACFKKDRGTKTRTPSNR
jgi:hypothetical protein